jgi:guanylate kinase
LNPLVLAGPSGAGKGTIIKALMDKYPTKFGFSVSHTTRAPRPGEEDGVHYHFVEKSKMENAINNDEFIEYAHVHTNIYGTSKLAVENVR